MEQLTSDWAVCLTWFSLVRSFGDWSLYSIVAENPRISACQSSRHRSSRAMSYFGVYSNWRWHFDPWASMCLCLKRNSRSSCMTTINYWPSVSMKPLSRLGLVLRLCTSCLFCCCSTTMDFFLLENKFDNLFGSLPAMFPFSWIGNDLRLAFNEGVSCSSRDICWNSSKVNEPKCWTVVLFNRARSLLRQMPRRIGWLCRRNAATSDLIRSSVNAIGGWRTFFSLRKTRISPGKEQWERMMITC